LLTPAVSELPAMVPGGTWEVSIQLFANAAHTELFSLSGWTTLLEVKTFKVMTSGSGLTITAGEGLIVALATGAETEAVNRELHYYLKLSKTGSIVYPLHGTIPVILP
jgi:hypothetical protein